jgi:succinoglycan biosynthesis transport protein ExoP
MEITHYLLIARRWLWLLLIGLMLGVVGGYGIAELQTPVYQASTRVIASRASMQAVSNGGSAPTSSNMFDFYYITDQQLMETFIELLKSSSIFDKASQSLGYHISPQQVDAEQVKDTRILSIVVEDTDSQRAADIANAIVKALIQQNEELEASRYKSTDENLQTQITQVEGKISEYQTNLNNQSNLNLNEQLTQVEAQMKPLQAEVTQLKKDISILSPTFSAESKSKVTELTARLDQIEPLLTSYQKIYADLVVASASGNNQNDNSPTNRLQSTLVLYQQIYLNLINTRESIRLSRLQNSQSISQIQVAVVPKSPIRPQPLVTAMFAGLVGLVLAAGIAFVIEYFDDTLKSPEDVERIFDIPLIGYIAEMEANSNAGESVYVSNQPRSPVSEAFRSLRTNIEFAGVDKPLRIILVTGAEAGDGKTTIAANLAAIFAQSGQKVMLLDCDLRRPRLHRFFGIQNRAGMTDLFRDSLDLDAVIQQVNSNSMPISIITSGSLPPNPAELLGSQKMNQILTKISKQADVIVIDSPPSIVSDSQVLAAKADGVLLVVQPGKTHIGAAKATREQLERAGARILGIVFNRIPRNRGYYYGGYKYYSPYYRHSGYDHYTKNEPVTGVNPQSWFGRLSSPTRKKTNSKAKVLDSALGKNE